jgi:leader peptidase (prepilin peptidase)/N-methyltransferase
MLSVFTVILVFLFVLGLVIGSFLNVVILRYNTGKSLGGRSGCFSCGNKLNSIDLLPVLGFFINKGECRYCHAKISWQYPLVEIITGIIFSAIGFLNLSEIINFLLNYSSIGLINVFLLLLIFIIASLLIAISVYDIRHKIIPDGLVYAFIIISLVYSLTKIFISPISFPWWQILVAGPIVALPFLLIWIISKGTWVGFGDIKLLLGIGWFLGIIGGILSIFAASFLGLIYSLILMLINNLSKTNKKITMKSEIPFGPFLIFGAMITYVIFQNYGPLSNFLLNLIYVS